MKTIIISFSENLKLKVYLTVESSMSTTEIDSLVEETFGEVPSTKTWEKL